MIEKPFPYQHKKTCESTHPVRDNCKLRETLVFNGARRLYLKFDPKCSTQYDYDKLTLYAGIGR
jgi:E3 ubiquitin-protein ligase HECTD4